MKDMKISFFWCRRSGVENQSSPIGSIVHSLSVGVSGCTKSRGVGPARMRTVYPVFTSNGALQLSEGLGWVDHVKKLLVPTAPWPGQSSWNDRDPAARASPGAIHVCLRGCAQRRPKEN